MSSILINKTIIKTNVSEVVAQVTQMFEDMRVFSDANPQYKERGQLEALEIYYRFGRGAGLTTGLVNILRHASEETLVICPAGGALNDLMNRCLAGVHPQMSKPSITIFSRISNGEIDLLPFKYIIFSDYLGRPERITEVRQWFKDRIRDGGMPNYKFTFFLG